MEIILSEAATFLNEKDKFYILTHQYPDGDTLGSACALCLALQKKGKMAKILCSDEIPRKFSFLFENVKEQDFDCETVISVDVGDVRLLGENLSQYRNSVDLCIDHHMTTSPYAAKHFIDPTASATCQIIYKLLCLMKVNITKDIAACIYTGIATDTGCFKYKNTAPVDHIIAADMMEKGADFCSINRLMFETKTRACVLIEKMVLETIEFFCAGKCAMILISNEMKAKAEAKDEDIDGFASLPTQIEGVLIGITIREKGHEYYKVSVRSVGNIDASKICERFNGGGHFGSAGCEIRGNLSFVKAELINEVSKIIGEKV